MIFGINTTSDIITYNNFEISLVVFMPNITTNHAITYTNGLYNKFGEILSVLIRAKRLFCAPVYKMPSTIPKKNFTDREKKIDPNYQGLEARMLSSNLCVYMGQNKQSIDCKLLQDY